MRKFILMSILALSSTALACPPPVFTGNCDNAEACANARAAAEAAYNTCVQQEAAARQAALQATEDAKAAAAADALKAAAAAGQPVVPTDPAVNDSEIMKQ